jgi:hypothetical protein
LSAIVKYTTEPLSEILNFITLSLQDNDKVTFEALNPDIIDHTFSGEIVDVNGELFVNRGIKVWVNLAELLGCKMTTPEKTSKHLIKITFKKLDTSNSFHTMAIPKKEEKYGSDSLFARISKNEEPTFLYHYIQALKAVNINLRKSILNLGVNRADEFDVIQALVDNEAFKTINLVGIDHSASALKVSKQKFPQASFFETDINDIHKLNLDRFDLIMSIGTMQSPSINYKPFLMSLVQNYLNENGAIILGFPNSRWIDGELIYGAKAPNYSYSEMSLLFNDVIFAKKYLQQKKFRVTITGREYIFLTATKIG